MNDRIALLAAALLISAPLRAQTVAENLRAEGAGALAASFQALSALAAKTRLDAPVRPEPGHPGRWIPRGEELPENCANLPVVAIQDGGIFKNGQKIGDHAFTYRANCDGTVAWLNDSGELYRDAGSVADHVVEFDVAWHGDTVVWKDSSGDLHRDGDDLGRAEGYTFVKYTGDVVWRDGWGDLYRNREKLGRSQNYAVAARTATVAWVDDFGNLHRDGVELGRAQTWQISDRTGDVGWLDEYQNLHKNGVQVGADVNQFTLREDGKLIWVDSWGVTHSA
ncbi:MAG: hypothetical protein KGJ84_08110 [Elusimicrobia bacterium]|nr:hypothetical protein [Elusimicrobiota bacterium]